jgi:Secretory lipase
MSQRRTGLIAGLAASVVGGAALLVTAPATSLVDAPAYSVDDALAADLDTPITPQLPDFYKVSSWQPGEPGTLVKAEPIADAPADVNMYRIMYQSTDLEGNAIPVTALYVAPSGPAPTGGFPLVGFAHGTTGIGQMCGISQTPLIEQTPGYSAWIPHIQPLVEQGWAVVATDYSGMGAPGPSSYLVGPLEARGILDSMRAVIAPSPQTGDIAVNASQLGIYGKSQGGEAAMAALELAPSYAPDLQIAGGAILAPGFTPAIQGVLDAVASNPTSTAQNMFVLLIAQSYAENYPDLVDLDDILTPLGQEKAKLLATTCGSDLADQVSDVPLSQLLNTPLATGLVTALSEAMPGTQRLEMPIVVVQGLKDKTILPQFTHAQVMSQCALGSTVFYVRYPDDDHPSINYQARVNDPSVLDWMTARWEGKPAPSNCFNQLLGSSTSSTGVNP